MATTEITLERPDADAVGSAACCAPGGGGLAPEAAVDVARTFKALADPARVRLLSIVASAEAGETCVCDLTEPVGLAQPTVSHHMKLLVEAGLVTREKRGKWAYYAVAPQARSLVEQAMRAAFAPTPTLGGTDAQDLDAPRSGLAFS